MQQTIVSVVLPVPPEQVDALHAAILALREKLGGDTDDFAVLRANLPTLHFMSILLFAPGAGVPAGDIPANPLFVLEANVDGASGPFWPTLEALIGEDIRALLRLCAPPRGRFDTMFKAVVAPLSRSPIAPLLDRQSVFPAASHAGARGLSRDRILRQNAMFVAAEKLLPPPADVVTSGAAAIHAWLRPQLVADFSWLDEPWTPGITVEDHSRDQSRLLIFAIIVLVAAFLPWLLLAEVLGAFTRHPVADTLTFALLTGAACMTQLHDIGDLLTLAGRKPATEAWWMLAAGLVAAAVLAFFAIGGKPIAALLFLVGIPLASVLLLLASLRRRERADPAPPDSVPDPAAVRALQDWEDLHVAGADHMGSVVIIKPGLFRAFLLRFGMRALNLAVRYIATDGYLGSMRTIHFAHWGIVDGGNRLLFLSNFDGSWESYLDDFIEKAHAGLTLAWGNCLGFPPARYLTLDGATQGRKFKAWARCSMTPSRLWYAAYPNLTVNQIWRQSRVAQGLSAKTLPPDKAATWARDL
jgi:hypothetical protein